jgi:hypothetical protein
MDDRSVGPLLTHLSAASLRVGSRGIEEREMPGNLRFPGFLPWTSKGHSPVRQIRRIALKLGSAGQVGFVCRKGQTQAR